MLVRRWRRLPAQVHTSWNMRLCTAIGELRSQEVLHAAHWPTADEGPPEGGFDICLLDGVQLGASRDVVGDETFEVVRREGRCARSVWFVEEAQVPGVSQMAFVSTSRSAKSLMR